MILNILLAISASFQLHAADGGDVATSTITGTAVGATTATLSTMGSVVQTRISLKMECKKCAGVDQIKTFGKITEEDCSNITQPESCSNPSSECECGKAMVIKCQAHCNSIIVQQSGLKNALIISGTVGGVTGSIQGFSQALMADPSASDNGASVTGITPDAFDSGAIDSTSSFLKSNTASCESMPTEDERQRCYCESNGWQYNPSTKVCSDTNTDIIPGGDTLVAENSVLPVTPGTDTEQPQTGLPGSDQSEPGDSAGATGSGSGGDDSGIESTSTRFKNKLQPLTKKKSLTALAAASRAKTTGKSNFTNHGGGELSDEYADMYKNYGYSSGKNEIAPADRDLFALISQRIREKYESRELGILISIRNPASVKAKRKYRSRSRR
ncbi:MAG: hypothetical protein JXA66_06375 [Oligoflexia bacterium]|nr:hypothetical protein [Oligoflexia bacterium]